VPISGAIPLKKEYMHLAAAEFLWRHQKLSVFDLPSGEIEIKQSVSESGPLTLSL
jgi:hypothetical protein